MSPFNAHCGATFWPIEADQTFYLQNTNETTYPNIVPGAEGVFGGDADWPLGVLMSRVIYGAVSGEGLEGHGGPFAYRSCLGYSFRYNSSGPSFALRMRWGGTNHQP